MIKTIPGRRKQDGRLSVILTVHAVQQCFCFTPQLRVLWRRRQRVRLAEPPRQEWAAPQWPPAAEPPAWPVCAPSYPSTSLSWVFP